jgi:hypothetical protein
MRKFAGDFPRKEQAVGAYTRAVPVNPLDDVTACGMPHPPACCCIDAAPCEEPGRPPIEDVKLDVPGAARGATCCEYCPEEEE